MHSERKKRLPLSYNCEECKFRCIEAKRLEFHKLEHKTTSSIYQCDKCESTFKTTYRLYLHDYNVHTTELTKQFACSECEYRTYTIRNLQVHKMRHKSTCQMCNEGFAHSADLNKHMKEQHSKTAFIHKCTECGVLYPTKSLLKYHEAAHAKKAGIKSFMCHLCAKAFTNDISLKQHVSRVHREKKHQCSTCGMLFKEKHLLRRHEVKHSDELKHICDVCGKAYKRRNTLTTHMATHSGSRSHKCQQCENSYHTKSSLQKHIDRCRIDECSVDTKDREFVCAVCSKSYTKKYILTKHMIIHSTDRPYSCKICGKSWKYKRSLKDHEGVHSDNCSLDFQCQKCDRRFRLKQSLKDHMSKVHCPEDVRQERLRQRVQQDRARKQRKHLEKIANYNSTEEETCNEPTKLPDLNRVSRRQMQLHEIYQNPTESITKTTAVSQLLLTESCDEIGASLNRTSGGETSGDGSQHIEDNIAANQVSDTMGDGDGSECYFDRTIFIGHGNDFLFHKDIQSKLDTNEYQENFYNSILPENNDLGKSKEKMSEVLGSNISCRHDFVSKTQDMFNRSTINRDLDNIDSTNIRSSKYMVTQLFQGHESSDNAESKSLQTLESEVVNQSSQESNHDKRKNTHKSGMLEARAKRQVMPEKTTNKTSTRLQQIFKCETCSIKFRQQETLVMHMVHVHDLDERKAKNLSTPRYTFSSPGRFALI